MAFLSNIARSEGDPKVISTGPSSLGPSDSMARSLGWFSLGLGLAELLAAPSLARFLGMEGRENLLRTYGLREIGSGMLTLSIDKQAGLMSRIAGDGLDIATLYSAMRDDNPKKQNVGMALAMVLGVTFLDVVSTGATYNRHARSRGKIRDYRDRSGFPGGLEAARRLAGNGGASTSRARVDGGARGDGDGLETISTDANRDPIEELSAIASPAPSGSRTNASL